MQIVILNDQGKLETLELEDFLEQLKPAPELGELSSTLEAVSRQGQKQDEELQAIRRRLRTLEGKATQTPRVFAVKPDFDASKWPTELARRYTEVRLWLVQFAGQTVDKMIAGTALFGGVRSAEVAHMKDFRFVQTYTNALLTLMRLGDPWAATELARVWRGLRARTTDRYGALASHKNLEQPGVLRWLYAPEVGGELDGTPTAHTDIHELERDLISGTIAEALRGLWDNLGIPECKAEHDALLAFYREHWLVRREFLAKNLIPKVPTFMYGSGLVHPTISRYCEHGHMHTMHGRAEDKEAMDTFGGWLAADHDFVQAPDGKPVVVFPQGCQGRYQAVTGQGKNAGMHWMVYSPESFPAYEIASWCGLPLATEALLNALPRTLHWTLAAPNGVEHGTWALDIGGGPAKSSARRVVQFRDGSSVPGRWQIAASTASGQGSHSLARGLSHLGAYRVAESVPGLEAEMQGLLARYKSAGHRGITVPLLLIEAKRQGRL